MWSTSGAAPALLVNTTEVETGRRRVISPFPIDVTYPDQAVWFYDDLGVAPFYNGDEQGAKAIHVRDIRVSTAVGISARFPYVLPAATVMRGRSAVHLVDGGYFDNSGVETTGIFWPTWLRSAMLVSYLAR